MISSIQQRKAISRQICQDHPEVIDALEAASESREDAMNKVDDGSYESFFRECQIEVPIASAVLEALYARQDAERKDLPVAISSFTQYTLDEWETVPVEKRTEAPKKVEIEQDYRPYRPRKMQLDELLEKLDYDEELIQRIVESGVRTFTYDDNGDAPVVLSPVELRYMAGAARRRNETRGDAFRVPNMRVFLSRAEREKEEQDAQRSQGQCEKLDAATSEQISLEKVARRAHPALEVFKWVYYRNARERQQAVTIVHSDMRCERQGPCECDFHLSFRFPDVLYFIDLIPRVKQGRKQTNTEMFEALGHVLQSHFELEGPRVARKGRQDQVNWLRRRGGPQLTYPLPDATLFQLLQYRYRLNLEVQWSQGYETTLLFLSPQVLARIVASSKAPPFVKWLFAKERRSSQFCLAVAESERWRVCVMWKERVIREITCPVKDDLVDHLVRFCEREYGMEANPTFFPEMKTPPGVVLLLVELARQYDKVSVLTGSLERPSVRAMLEARAVDYEMAHEGVPPQERVCVDFRRTAELLGVPHWVSSLHRSRKCFRYVVSGLVFHSSFEKVCLFEQEMKGEQVEWVDW